MLLKMGRGLSEVLHSHPKLSTPAMRGIISVVTQDVLVDQMANGQVPFQVVFQWTAVTQETFRMETENYCLVQFTGVLLFILVRLVLKQAALQPVPVKPVETGQDRSQLVVVRMHECWTPPHTTTYAVPFTQCLLYAHTADKTHNAQDITQHITSNT